ncbi:hypothetical protein AYK25_02670 [Thermoplasmatales archaeon SM1-50]|nr:MAG: hypothetical protein AYK25_02670 [Thermoplasmatales archaeon SM1-50]
MKVVKKIIVGSIILVMISTAILGSAKVNNDKNPSSLNISDENSLGTAILKHQPLLRTIIGDQGLITDYEPPVGNPTYDYYFPEDENGYVELNFSLNVQHLINPIPIYWAKWIFPRTYRWSGITLYVNYAGEDYCYSKTTTLCNTTFLVNYNISINSSKQLFTNNNTLECKLIVFAWPGATPIPYIHDLCEAYFPDEVINTNITIHPI